VAEVRSQANALIAGLPGAFPQVPFAQTIVNEVRLASAAAPLKEQLVGRVQGALWILLAAVGVVLAIACANVANLFLVRLDGRQREVAVRRALGASRRAVMAYFLAESMLLAVVGGALGLGFALAGVRALIALGPDHLPRLHEVRVDAVVVAFTAAVSLLAGLLFGGLPLLRRGFGLAATLHETGRGNTAARGRLRVRQALVAAQVALALMLLVSSGLLVRSFDRMRSIDAGFDAEDRLVFRVALPERVYPLAEPERAVAVHTALLERVRAMPGVVAASAANCLPLQGICFGDPVDVQGRAYSPGTLPPIVVVRRVLDGYFETVGTELVAGRLLERADQQRPNSAAVIDRAMAEVYFPNEDAIGKRIYPGIWPEGAPGSYEIVGVVENTVAQTLTEQPGPKIYLPLGSGPYANSPAPNYASYVVHATVPPLSLLPAIRAALSELDPNAPVAAAELFTEVRANAGAQMAFTMVLLAIAASVALVLGIVGLYAVVSYAVSQRSGEIGVRMALGARPAAVSAMILRQGGVMVLTGLVVGIAAALATSRMLRALLFQVEPSDTLTYAAVSLSLLVVALFACWLPARRAAHMDPVRTLRAE
jgi:predicted permease